MTIFLSSILYFHDEVFARCPNGTYKSESGLCESFTNTNELPTCLNGDSYGNCEKVNGSFGTSMEQEIRSQNSDIISNPSDFGNTTAAFLTYNSPLYGFKIDYPQGAKINENPELVVINLPNFYSEPNFDIRFSPAVRIETNIGIKPNMTLDSLTRELVSNSIHHDEQSPQTSHIFSINKTKVRGSGDANLAFYDFEFKHYEYKQTYKVLQVVTIHDGSAYNLQFAAYPEEFNKYLPTVRKMIDSFEVISLT